MVGELCTLHSAASPEGAGNQCLMTHYVARAKIALELLRLLRVCIERPALLLRQPSNEVSARKLVMFACRAAPQPRPKCESSQHLQCPTGSCVVELGHKGLSLNILAALCKLSLLGCKKNIGVLWLSDRYSLPSPTSGLVVQSRHAAATCSSCPCEA